MHNKHNEFMTLAIKKAKDGMNDGQTPFGAVIVKDGKVVSAVHNKVWEANDITAHAEVTAIREACKVLNTVDLSGCEIYSTCEPCPMCFSAIHWAKITKIYYGASICDAKEAGFQELEISNTQMKNLADLNIEIVPNILKKESQQLFLDFKNSSEKKVY